MENIEKILNRELTEKEKEYFEFSSYKRKLQENNEFVPKFHFYAPEDILNDPNGLCFWQGRWHMFYQAFPPEREICWGHAISEDLIHWTDLPYALEPVDEKACWSGATLVEENRVIAIFHAFPIGNVVAVSEDPLLMKWERVGMIPKKEGDPYEVFDPCIWKDGEYYYSLSGGKVELPASWRGQRSEFVFRSKNLVDWEYVHPFFEGGFDAVPGEDGACPYFWPLGDKHLLMHFSHTSGAKYLLGSYDRENQRFLPLRGGSLNNYNISSSYLGGACAPSAAPLDNGDIMAVINYSSSCDEEGCKQIVSLPRRYHLYGANNDEVGVKPMIDFSNMYEPDGQVKEMILSAGKKVTIPELSGDCMELVMEFEASDTTPTLELELLCNADGSEYTTVRIYRQRGMRNWDHFNELGEWGGTSFTSCVMIDNTYSSLRKDFICRPPEMMSYFHHPKDTVQLKIFIDRKIIEVFINDSVCVTARAYPSSENSTGVTVKALECDTKLLHAERYTFKG